MEKAKRHIWVDVLNICACAGVLLLHCTNYALWDYSGIITYDFCFSIISHGFVLWPVDVFFMITGFTLIKRSDNPQKSLEKESLHSFYHRRLTRLLIPVLVWNTYYGALLFRKLYSEGDLCIREFIVTFLQFESNGFLWFFIPLIGIYLVLPYYSVLCNSLSRLQLRNYILIAFACICIPTSLSSWIGLTKYNNLFPIASGYLLFATIGYYIGNFELSHRTKKIIYTMGILACLVLTIGLFIKKIYLLDNQVSYMGVCCSLSAIAFFTWIRNINFDKSLGGVIVRSGILKKWSSLSLGVYLIQMTLLSLLNKYSGIESGLGRFIILYPLCIISVYMIQHIPYIRRIV